MEADGQILIREVTVVFASRVLLSLSCALLPLSSYVL